MNGQHARRTALLLLVVLGSVRAPGQGVPSLLTVEGLDRSVTRTARATAMGGASVAVCGDAGALFANPAALSVLQTAEIRTGFSWTSSSITQTQAWIPNRFYPNFTLLMENMTHLIRDPVITDPKDALQRPYDDLGPNWEATTRRLRPTMAVAAFPFEVGGMRVVAAAGFSHAFNLDTYVQNNNGLDPNIGLYRPSPMSVLRGTDTLAVRWFTSRSERIGAIFGITPGFSVDLTDQLSVGGSMTVLTGRSDDLFYRRDRGLLVFDAVYRVVNYPAQYTASSAGTSDYSGVLTMLGFTFRERYFSVAGAIRPGATITREWGRTDVKDSAGASSRQLVSGSDQLEVPVSYSLGLLLTPTLRWNIGIDYVVGQSGDAVYTAAGGGGTNPWLSTNILRAGAEYRALDWLALRVGYRDVARTFAPEGTGLIGDPVTGSAYTAGVGLSHGALGVDVAYEYQTVKYQDLWETNVNDNNEIQHGVIVEFSVRL